MIYVTKEARQELNRYLSIGKRSRNKSLRIIDKGHGKLGLVNDARRPDDDVVEFEGRILLVAEPAISSGPKNISLDAYTAADIRRIVISEENVNELSSSVTVNWISFPKTSCRKN